MASSRLYKEARTQFVREAEARYQDGKDLDMLRDFLAQNGSPEEAQAAAGTLKQKSGEKWGSKRVGDTEIPAAWIDKLMSNIGNFVTVGNYAMKGAPESVGLAWFAVKLTLSAIQSNYELYTFFGSALTDISEIMIIIPHYDRLYDERAKPTSKAEWKASPVVDKLFQDIIQAYAAVINFSFSIRRHLGAGTLAKLRHGFKDFFGTSKGKFTSQMDTIASLKKKILEDSQAIFQDKSLHQLDAVKGIVSNIEGTVNEIKSFQGTMQRMHEEQTAQWQLVLKNMEDIKATTKPKTPWDHALQKFEKNKDALNPQRNTLDALGDAIDQRHPGTCQWIFERPEYMDWKTSTASGMLCLSGQQDSGKSTVLATLVEQLDLSDDRETVLLYLNCGSLRGGATIKGAASVEAVCHTLLFQLYNRAREDETNVKLLEDCNKVFNNPKANTHSIAISMSNKEEDLPEFADAFISLAIRMNIGVVIALDEVDNLSSNDQHDLAEKLQAVIASSKAATTESLLMKVVVGCRSASKFYNQVLNTKTLLRCVDVGSFNNEDMAKQLADELRHIPGLTQAEQEEAIEAILKKAGPGFAYIKNIAVPFMREPFQRPLSRRLQSLPEGMNNIYNEALRKMGSNYIELLHTALTWALLAQVPPRVDEIMDAYRGIYSNRSTEVEEKTGPLDDETFLRPSELEIEQLRDASGPFLRLEQEPYTRHYFVHLQDPPQVRDFCLQTTGAYPEVTSGGEVCVRCRSAIGASTTFSISPKDGHLKLALECLRHLNNPIFQRRAMAFDEASQWSQPADSERRYSKGHAEEVNGVDIDTSITSRSIPIEEVKSEVEAPAEEAAEELVRSDINQDDNAGLIDENPGNEKLVGKGREDSLAAEAAYESDDSKDDEDRGEINFTKTPKTGDEVDVPEMDYEVRLYRYELDYWPYHIRQAQELWTPEERLENSTWAELMNELDHFVSANASFFSWWQQLDETFASYQGLLSPLHVAANLGLTSWASYLLENGADPNVKPDGRPEMPIQLAALMADSPTMLKLLLESGADLNAEDASVPPAFHSWLLNDSSLESVQLMLKHGANPTMSDQKSKWTALHYFAWQGGDVAVLDLLLNHATGKVKPDINAVDDSGNSPLHVLLWRREVPKNLLQAFVDRGADVNAENTFSARPLQMASVYGDLETLQILCHQQAITEIDDDDNNGNSALQQAAINNHANCMRFLVEIGADPNMQNKRGRAPLHQSAWQGTKECVDILLAHGANPVIVDKHNRTPLFFACLDDASDNANLVLDTLLERKIPMAEINALTRRRRSPLRQAAGHGFDDIVERLIKAAEAAGDLASLALNERDTRKGMTPLHRAAWFGRVGCVRLLITATADVTVRDHNDKTSLVLAYEQWALASQQSAFEDIISLLIEQDSKSAIADAELVAICAVNGSTRLLQQLAALGADLNRQDRYGWTPLELARKFHQDDAGRFLKQQAAWAGMLPSRWAKDARTHISDDGKRVKHTSGELVCISTDKPLPAGLDKFYFEVTSNTLDDSITRQQPEWPALALGFCTMGGTVIRFPGWPPRQDAPSARSWGYHGDDGSLFHSGNGKFEPVATELPYRAGYTVGCGVDLTTQTIWFTRNGRKLDSGFSNVQGRLFPLLGLEDTVEVETNFMGPFMWKDDNGENEKGTEKAVVIGSAARQC